jgi:lipid II:glycine glycyltransferase (peptidoglycan interpeptide bridge formation enzyme)
MQDLRQSPNHAKFLKSMGWIVETKNGVNYFIKKFPIVGSFIKIQRPKEIDFEYIQRLKKEHRAFQIIIEPSLSSSDSPRFRPFGQYSARTGPTEDHTAISVPKNNHDLFYTHGFKECKSPFLPSKTIFIDLTKSEKTLLKEMHQKTRYNIKIAKRNKVEILKSKDIEMFINFWHICHQKRLLFLNQKKQMREIYKAFVNNADILFAFKDDFPVAALLILHHDKVGYYMYAASDDEGRSLFAPTLLTWEGIRLSKKRESNYFDFEGIYDNRFPIESWKGFTKFKKGFGGEEIEFPVCYMKYYLPI